MKRKTHEEFANEVYDIVRDEYIIVDEYVNARTKVTFKHNCIDCEFNEFPMKSNDFLINNQRCPKCSKKKGDIKKTKTHQQFLKEVIQLHGDIFEFLTEYTYSLTNVKVRHKYCGYTWDVAPRTILDKRYKEKKLCAKCNEVLKLDTDAFKKRVFNVVGNEYKVIGEYDTNMIHIKMQHTIGKCNCFFEVTPHGFTNDNSRCPECFPHISKGEINIITVLDKNNVKYQKQFKFNDCKLVFNLKFDFAIFNNKGELEYLIEYDGIQHFEQVEHFGGEDGFKNNRLRDQIKNQYCIDNNITLYRIPYWKFNKIESILNKLIHNENVEVEKASFLVQ